MKGQFIRSCSGRQNILPQCFTDCLDEEWEHISAVPGPGLGRAGNERMEQQQPGTVPSQPDANTPGGRGSGAHEDVL